MLDGLYACIVKCKLGEKNLKTTVTATLEIELLDMKRLIVNFPLMISYSRLEIAVSLPLR